MNKILFPKITFLLLLLIPLTFFGFNPTYFSKIFNTDLVYHAHALFMLLWVAMAIVQPLLIHKKKTALHKTVGKASYVIMPMVFITSYLIIKHTYYNFINTRVVEAQQSAEVFTPDQLNVMAASYVMIGVVYIIWLFVFYVLAVISRKKIVHHSTFMFAAILTLLGPTIDRIMYQVTMLFGGSFNVFVENAVFALNLSILSALLLYQKKKGTNFNPALIALCIYALGIAGYHLLPKTAIWSSFIAAVL